MGFLQRQSWTPRVRTRVLTAQQDLVGSLLKVGGEVKVKVARRGIKVSQLKSDGYIVH